MAPGAENSQDVEAIDVTQHDVQDKNIWTKTLCKAQSRAAIVGCLDVHSGHSQSGGHKKRDVFLVVDHQNFRCAHTSNIIAQVPVG